MAEAARGLVSDEQKAALTLPGGKSAIPGNQLKLGKTFVTFMDAQPELRGLIDQGKGNLQWERDIPAAALANLESLANSDFKANLGKIIHDIYQTAHQMFSDMPQGDHKKRAKYRFAWAFTPRAGTVHEWITSAAETKTRTSTFIGRTTRLS